MTESLLTFQVLTINKILSGYTILQYFLGNKDNNINQFSKANRRLNGGSIYF